MAIKQEGTPAPQAGTFQEKYGSEGKPFRIGLPPRDKYDWIGYGASLLLVLVGILGIVVGACTLLFIRAQVVQMRRQAEVMEAQTRILTESVAVAQKSAEVAEKSADAFVSAERAWILARINKIVVPFPYTTMIRIPDAVECELIFKNYGATPAVIESFSCETQSTIPVFEFPLPPQYGERKNRRIILAPQEEKVIGTVFPVEQFPDIPIERAIFIGYVNYGGIFEGERGTKFCFGLDRENDSFIPIGPPAYNDAT
jgi:hypothetical protein